MIVLPPVYNAGDTVYCYFDTYGANGASITASGLAVTDIEIYKNGSTTQRASDNGYALLDTDGIDFDGATGLHGFSIDTSDNSDSGFWTDGAHYLIHVNAITVDSQTVRFSFELTLGYLLRPTTAGRKADVSAGGEMGIDWANIGSPTTTVNLSGTTVKTATDVESDTQDIQSRLPAALGANGNMKADVRDYNGTAGTFSGGKPEVNVGANGISASSLASSATTEIADAARDSLLDFDLANYNSAGGSLAEALQETESNTETLLTRMGTPSNLGSGATVAGNLVDIESQTDDIGAAGAGLTAVPWNASWDAEVQSEVADALAVYDPAEAIIKKNVAFDDFPFPMYDTEGNLAIEKTVTATRSIDGGAFAACANAATETGGGWYKIDLAATDLNGNSVALKFTATGCAPTNVSILPES